MRRCALLTMTDIGHYITYDHLLLEPLAQQGWLAELVAWDGAVDWNCFDAVIIRSTWDYQDRLPAFLAVLEQIEHSRARLLNPLSIVRWNHDKRYLLDLQQRGCGIVPTQFAEQLHAEHIANAFSRFATDQLIIKPVVSAAALNTHVLHRHDWQDRVDQLLPMFRDQGAMLQPFIHSVVSEGEYSLFYFAGQFSHAIVKRPKSGDFRVQEEYGSQLLRIDADQTLLQAGARGLAAIAQTLLYARVDLIRLEDGTLAIMELELIEPSLYFNMDEGSARRFADAMKIMC